MKDKELREKVDNLEKYVKNIELIFDHKINGYSDKEKAERKFYFPFDNMLLLDKGIIERLNVIEKHLTLINKYFGLKLIKIQPKNEEILLIKNKKNDRQEKTS